MDNESWLYNTDSEREEKIHNLFKDEMGITNFNQHGAFKSFSSVIVKIVNYIYKLLADLLLQTNIDEATGFFLILWGALIGVFKKPSQKAVRKLLGISYAVGNIKKGSWINVSGTDLRFKVLSDIAFDKNVTFEIDVEAEFEGAEYNISSNYQVKFSKVIKGLERVDVPDLESYKLISGLDEEKEDSFRDRIKNKWKSVGEESPPSKYIYITKSVVGVDDCKIFRVPRGSGSVDVIVTISNGANENEVLQKVYSDIEERIGTARDVMVKKAIDKPVNISITFSGSATEGMILSEVQAFFYKRIIGQKKSIADLYAKLKNNALLGLTSIIIEPNQDFECDAYEVLTLNTVNIVKV